MIIRRRVCVSKRPCPNEKKRKIKEKLGTAAAVLTTRRRDRRAVRVPCHTCWFWLRARAPRKRNLITLAPRRLFRVLRVNSLSHSLSLLRRAATRASKEGCSLRRRRWCVCVSRVIAARSILYIRATTVYDDGRCRRRRRRRAKVRCVLVFLGGGGGEGESGARTGEVSRFPRIYGTRSPPTRPADNRRRQYLRAHPSVV